MFGERKDVMERDDPIALIDRSPAPTGILDPRYVRERQMICIACSGMWTPEQVDACFDTLRIQIGEMRASFGRVRVLVDRREAVPQPASTVERLRSHTHMGYLPGDRIAVVVDSSLSKMQLRDQLDPETHKLFISENAATTWLTAHD
jgi:hypothetical protein